MSIELTPAATRRHFAQARELMLELMAWDCSQVSALGLDGKAAERCYYEGGNFRLPGEYARPDGLLLLALDGREAAGCGAFSNLTADICELKRVYVRTRYRGQGIGARLATRLIEEAQRANYLRIRLETVSFMTAALALYRRMGFQDCAAYNEIPEDFREITVCMELDLYPSPHRPDERAAG